MMAYSPATDTVTGHARGCAREQACPKLESMWTRKYGFLLMAYLHQNEYIIISLSLVIQYTTMWDHTRPPRAQRLAIGLGTGGILIQCVLTVYIVCYFQITDGNGNAHDGDDVVRTQ